MFKANRCAKINVKVLVILILVTVALVTSLFAARQVRRSLLSRMALQAGQAAFEQKDWVTASKQFQEYLGRNPDDVAVLRKYAKARLSVRPLDAAAVGGAIAAYRRIVQLDPLDEAAYEKLAQLYAGIGNFEELAYIARTRLSLAPQDQKAPLWLAEALNQMRKTDAARQTLEPFIKRLDADPNKPREYVQACELMSRIMLDPASSGTSAQALEWLNKAVTACPKSAEALVYRARFYRQQQDIKDMNEDQRLAAAKKDLEAADKSGTDDPRIRLALAAEWLQQGELDRTAAELQAVENPPQQALQKYFLDVGDWTVAKFLLASQLALKRNAGAEGAALADKTLKALTEKRHRVRVLPSAVGLYVAAGQAAKASQYLKEYLGLMQTQEGATSSRLGVAYLKALVAKAEDKPYAVIDALQPVVVSDTSRPELWRLLAEAFSRTDQSRRAVNALVKYLRLRPKDAQMKQQLAREYLRLGDWSQAYETARLAETQNPTDIVITLLRIESSIYLAAEQSYQPDPSRLAPLSAELANLRKKHPERVDIRIYQAIIADEMRKTDEAEQDLKQAIKECTDPLRAEMQLVKHYYRQKRMAEAVSTCRTACQRDPNTAEPWLALSGLYAAKADYDSARSVLKQGLQSVVGPWEQRSLTIQLALVEVLYGDRKVGIQLLSQLAEKDPQEIRARALLLNLREVRQNQKKAETLVEELRKAEGESGLDWRLYQAALWLAADDWRSKQQDITADVQYCINADPQWSAPPLLLANMYQKLDDLRRTEETYRRALGRNPAATDVADALISLLEKQGRFSDAEKVLSQVEANPRVTSAWHVRMALDAKDYSRAIQELKLRVSNDDRDANSRILLARLLYWQTGNADQAFALLKQAEAITPDSMALTAAKVAILRAEGRADDAQQILDTYVSDSKSFGAYAMRAAYLANAGQLKRAERDYRKLTSFSAQGPAGYELLSSFYARNQKLDQAVTALQEGLAVHPQDLGLKRRLMKTLLARNQGQDRQKALQILAALEQRLPQDPDLMQIRAAVLLEDPTAQSRQTAKDKLEKAVSLEPTAVNAHLMLIGLAMQDGQYEAARDEAIRALGANPDNPDLLLARGRAELAIDYAQMGDNPPHINAEMAANLAHMVLDKDPNSAQARDLLVGAALRSKDQKLLAEARTLIEAGLSAEPANEALLLSRAGVLLALGEPAAAIPELEAYCRTKKGGNSISAIATLADLYRISGDMNKAGQEIARAEKLDPHSLTAVHARFLWLVAQKRFDELSHVSSAYFAAKDPNPTAFVAAATILAASDSMPLKKEAVKLFERAVSLARTSKETRQARLGLASTLYQTGDVERAVTMYQELLKQYPDDKQALNDLAWILQEHEHRYDAALELANKGLVLWPDELHLLDTRGTILSKMGNRLADARKDFERLVESAPAGSAQQAKALLKLGRTCAKLNDPAQAKQRLQEALKIDGKINVFTAAERSEIEKILRTPGIQAANR
jgi:tetratricopeptide (TPR) repeat protein